MGNKVPKGDIAGCWWVVIGGIQGNFFFFSFEGGGAHNAPLAQGAYIRLRMACLFHVRRQLVRHADPRVRFGRSVDPRKSPLSSIISAISS